MAVSMARNRYILIKVGFEKDLKSAPFLMSEVQCDLGSWYFMKSYYLNVWDPCLITFWVGGYKIWIWFSKFSFSVVIYCIRESFNIVFRFLCWLQTQPERDPEKEKWMIGIMVFVTIVKFMLVVYCRRFKNDIIRAYAQDHFFDVITNSIGLAAAILAIRYYWWIDPTGAVIVSS